MRHGMQAYRELLGYEAITIGDPCKPLAASDLEALNPEKVGAVVVELPQRENGGATTSWEDLVAMRKWADTHGVALHLDGARLWEVQPSYGKPFSDITALFDTVYASFYKVCVCVCVCVCVAVCVWLYVRALCVCAAACVTARLCVGSCVPMDPCCRGWEPWWVQSYAAAHH